MERLFSKNIFRNYILLLFAIGFSGCATISPEKINSYYTPIPQSKKVIDIPIYGEAHPLKGHPYVFWNFCKQKQTQLGLSSPETSTDSLIFRMWITNQSSKSNQPHVLLELRKDSVKWNGQLIFMRVNFRNRKLAETITSHKIVALTPLKTDWVTIADSLFKLKFHALPTDDLIPDYYPNNSGYLNRQTTFAFEYATQDLYRFYQYNDLYRARDKFWEPDFVIKMLDYLEEEFLWDEQARKYFEK